MQVSRGPANRDVTIRQPTGKRIYEILVVIVVSVMAFVPAMIMLDAAMIAVPVAGEIFVTVMMRNDPVRAHVRRSSPIAVMPPVMPTHGIPIAFHPDIIRARPRRLHVNYARARRWSDSDS